MPSEAAVAEAAMAAISSTVFRYPSPFSSPVGNVETGGDLMLSVRANALTLPLGYLLSSHPPRPDEKTIRGVVAPASAIPLMSTSLDQLVQSYDRAGPVVIAVDATDFATGSDHRGGLFANYGAVLESAADYSVAVIGSTRPDDGEDMVVAAAVLARAAPAFYVYDGRQKRATWKQNSIPAELFNTLDTKVTSRDVSERADQLFKALESLTGAGYGPFEYAGHPQAERVLVVFGSVEARLASAAARKLSEGGSKVGVIAVRLFRPFLDPTFISALPGSTREVVVLGQVSSVVAEKDKSGRSTLYDAVLAAVRFSASPPLSRVRVRDIKYRVPTEWTIGWFGAVLSVADPAVVSPLAFEPTPINLADIGQVREAIVWDLDSAPACILDRLRDVGSQKNLGSGMAIDAAHHNLILGGTTRTDARLFPNHTIEDAPYQIESADVVYVADHTILTRFDIVSSIKKNGVLVVAGVPDSLEKAIPAPIRGQIANLQLKLYLAAADAQTELFLLGSDEDVPGVTRIEVPSKWADVYVADGDDKNLLVQQPAIIRPTGFCRVQHEDIHTDSIDEDGSRDNQLALVQSVLFPEAFGAETALRPDVSARTNIVSVKQIRRLTPETYDRNVFHIEFDLGATGITYAIGEALGVHPINEADAIDAFLTDYGLDGSSIVNLPSGQQGHGGGLVPTTTLFTTLRQHVDIFGPPPKRFYQSLAELATDSSEKAALAHLASPGGSADFKRRAEVDFVTFADILAEFRSARLGPADLVKLVGPIKRREFSIASSQRVSPDTVSLLVVTVEWTDPQGRRRSGLATRYLNALRPGDGVVVSVKPSVMKLPTDPSAPIIMAGLGTGLAPFRAFVQERAAQRLSGAKVGPVILFLGSRHQREEYLFGEEWEAYRDAGIITFLGTAFSRDQAEKVYIQDRMRQALSTLREEYIEKGGSFYLCGPTWPVPDVTEVLEEAIRLDWARLDDRPPVRSGDSRREIERLKEAGRYVLEVY